MKGVSGYDIEEGRKGWMEGTRFGEVHSQGGARLHAPELPPVPSKEGLGVLTCGYVPGSGIREAW